jgi:ParB-like chromosome segregation protein Spo0J
MLNSGLKNQIEIDITSLLKKIENLDIDSKIESINIIREITHKNSPFKDEPVDFVRWVKNDTVSANDYNPNTVAPPEMELLRHSIGHDGYTQPIVGWKQEFGHEVIDGFHRHRVGKEYEEVRNRVHGYLPIVEIKQDNEGRNDRIASTIRHNRARGKHRVDAMSEIVLDLKKRNWSDTKIAKELGMDQDEVLRLSQLTGLIEAFADSEFSTAWEVDNEEN